LLLRTGDGTHRTGGTGAQPRAHVGVRPAGGGGVRAGPAQHWRCSGRHCSALCSAGGGGRGRRQRLLRALPVGARR
jgi:hypothetical protein